MISRVSSHLLFCEPDRILRQSVVEQDEHHTVTAIFSLNDSLVEASQTSFYDGIISQEIVSLKLNLTSEQLAVIRDRYNYVDISSEDIVIDLKSNKQLLIDFGTKNTVEVNRIFLKVQNIFAAFPIFDFIAACVYYPALLVGHNAVLELNKCTELILWEQVDLVNKQLKTNTRISKI